MFNKLLYVEKKGQFPLLKAASIMERYDMGIVTGEGFSTVAARTLVQTAQTAQKDEKYQIFVLHDADYPGYNIVRTLRDATKRMPEHSVELHDLGLTVEQVIDMGKDPEEYERSSSIPSGLASLLSPDEEEWFVGECLGKRGKKDTYTSKRFELDDLTAPETIALAYSTLLGGEDADFGSGIAVDGRGMAYVTGFTTAPDFPTTRGAFDTTFSGGFRGTDAFVTKLLPTG